MFRALIAGTLVLIGGAFIAIAFGELSALAEIHSSQTANSYGDNSSWASILTTWWPLIPVLMVGTILIVTAINERRTGRGRI